MSTRPQAHAVVMPIRQRVMVGALACLAALLSPALAQQAAPTTRTLGILTAFVPPTPEQLAKGTRNVARLRELGWVDGRNLRIERAFAGNEERLPEFAAELVRKRVDAIWAWGPEATVAAARATQTIPIVFWGVPAPVEQGLVDSLARPGRNVTGVTFADGSVELAQKRLEFIRALVPGAKRVASIMVPSASRSVSGKAALAFVQNAEKTARKLGMELQQHLVERPDDLDGIFNRIIAARTQAVSISHTVLTVRERQRLVDFASRNRLPAMYGNRQFVEAGGLASYGSESQAIVLQSLDYVDRVLRGANPADMPVALPRTYELWINLGTAKALGIKVPPAVLARADRVIE